VNTVRKLPDSIRARYLKVEHGDRGRRAHVLGLPDQGLAPEFAPYQRTQAGWPVGPTPCAER